MPLPRPALPASLLSLARRQDDVVSTAQLRSAGIGAAELRTRVRRGEWQPLLRGTHLLHSRSGLLLTRSWARSASLALPGATVGLASAALLLGLDGVPEVDGVQVVVPPGAERGRRRGLEAHVWVLDEGERVFWAGVPVTSVERTLADLVPRLDRPTALAVLDSADRQGLVDADGLQRARELASRRPGCRAVDDLWGLADGRAESVLESRVRLRLIDGGQAPDAVQWRVRDAEGRVVARADLAVLRRSDPSRGPLLIEADGREPHGGPAAVYADRHRHNAVTALGCDTLRFTWSDTVSRRRIPTIVAAVR